MRGADHPAGGNRPRAARRRQSFSVDIARRNSRISWRKSPVAASAKKSISALAWRLGDKYGHGEIEMYLKFELGAAAVSSVLRIWHQRQAAGIAIVLVPSSRAGDSLDSAPRVASGEIAHAAIAAAIIERHVKSSRNSSASILPVNLTPARSEHPAMKICERHIDGGRRRRRRASR